MHDARAMQQVASIKSIHPSNLIPPTHVFNGEFLFLEFLIWASISTENIKNQCTCYAASSKYQVKLTSKVWYNIYPSNLIRPTHVFNGEFLFLGFFVWASISTGDIKYRRVCKSLKAIKHRNSISRYKGLAQSLLAQISF